VISVSPHTPTILPPSESSTGCPVSAQADDGLDENEAGTTASPISASARAASPAESSAMCSNSCRVPSSAGRGPAALHSMKAGTGVPHRATEPVLGRHAFAPAHDHGAREHVERVHVAHELRDIIVRGASTMSSAVPVWMMRPFCRIEIRSPRRNASSMSWLTKRMVFLTRS